MEDSTTEITEQQQSELEKLNMIVKNSYNKTTPQSRLTPQVVTDFGKLVKQGYSTKVICGIIGISEHTYNKWKQRGYALLQEREKMITDGLSEDDIPLAVESHFVLEVAKSNALHDMALFDAVASEAKSDGKFALDVLKTRESSGVENPDKKNNQSINLQGDNQKVIIVSPNMASSDEEFKQLVENNKIIEQ